MDLSIFKKKTITLDELYELISDNDRTQINKYKTIEYDFFYAKVKSLEECGMISPFGKAMNTKPKRLYLKYKIVKEEKKLSESELIWITSLNSRLNLSYYKKNVDEFRAHRKYIELINDYINSTEHNDNLDYISINERSYEIFSDEKFLKGSDKENKVSGLSILKKLKLNLDDLYCYDNYEPLLTLTLPGFFSKSSKNILIIENLDTYWTINRILFENHTIFEKEIDMLIYGQGNAIVGTFENYTLYNISESDEILYFGDIDNHGFYIYQQFKNKFNNLNIELASEWYEYLLFSVSDNKIRKVRKLNQKKVDADLLALYMNKFTDSSRSRALRILSNDEYIPQEGLNYSIIKNIQAQKRGE